MEKKPTPSQPSSGRLIYLVSQPITLLVDTAA